MAAPLLGEILFQNKEITEDQLNKALKIQKKDGGLIGIILVSQGVIKESTLVKYLALQAEKITE